MFSRKVKRDTLLNDKLQQLRSITNSNATNEASIVVDASNYIKKLKQKVETVLLNEATTIADDLITFPQVTVEKMEKGLLVNVKSGKSCPGLLVYILQTLEELGFNVVEARVSCSDTFHLQALAGESEKDEESIDAPMVKRAISNAIKNWTENYNDQ